jgi:excisionase family DNA binding protein
VVVTSQQLSRARTTVSPDFVSVAQAAVVLGVSRQHTYALVHRGELEAVRLGAGGLLRIPIPALTRLQQKA